MIFLVKFGINKHLLIFSLTTTRACLFQIALKIMWLLVQIEPLLGEVQVLFCLVFFSKDLKSLHGEDRVRYLTDISTVFNNFFP